MFDTPDTELEEEEQKLEEAQKGESDEETPKEDREEVDTDESREESEETGGVDIDALTTSPPKVTGSVSAGVGAGVGFIEWPGSSAADNRSVQDLLRFSGFYTTSARASVDVRPEPYLRFRTSVSTSLDTDAMSFTDPSMGELFIDYTLRDTIFFRAGRQGLTWGQGRLLSNPANLVSRVSSGVALRNTVPAGSGTINGVIYSKESWVQEHGKTDPRAFAYAAQWEQTFGPVATALMGHFQTDEDIGSAGSFSFGLGPIDVAADLVGSWVREDPSRGLNDWDAMGRVFWENDDRSWTLLAEYEFDSQVNDYEGHYTGLALRMPGLGGSGWRPAVRWKHAFQDDSGEVVPVIGGSIAPSLNMSISIPVVYGEPGSYYREALTKNVEDEGEDNIEEEDEEEIPIDNVVSLLFSISLSFSF